MSDTLSIIIPAYNEADNVAVVLRMVCAVELPYGVGKQIILVDDGSADHTYARADEFRRAHPQEDITLLRHAHNMGKGTAIRTALPRAAGRYTVIQDSDNELDPADLAPMLKKMIDGHLPVVYGSRFLRKSPRRLYRRYYYGARLLSALTNILYGQHISDEATCYKMFRTDLLKSLPLRCRGFEFCPEVTARVSRRGIKIVEIPVSYAPRSMEQGKKVRMRDGLQAVCTLLKYRFLPKPDTGQSAKFEE